MGIMLKRFFAAALIALLLPGALKAAEVKPAKARNVIVYVADGTGIETLGLLIYYARYAPSSIYEDRQSHLEKFINASATSMMTTTTAATLVTDSAAAATQFSSGALSLPEHIGIDYQGNPTTTLLEDAKKLGKATGLVTTTPIQDATPAAYGAHQLSRRSLEAISADFLATEPDIMFGGGAKHFTPQLLGRASTQGYELAFDIPSFEAAKGKILGLLAQQHMPFAIERNPNTPTLPQMAQKALDELSKNKKGFFLMVEAGKVDWAAHANDAGLLLHELLEFDQALAVLADYAQKNKDTLLIVMSDHDTGGFALNYRKAQEGDEPADVYGGTYYPLPEVLDLIAAQNTAYTDMSAQFNALAQQEQTPQAMADILTAGLGREVSADFVRSNGRTVAKVKAALERRDGIAWATGNHTAAPVMIYSFFSGKPTGYHGIYTTADLGAKLRRSLGAK